MSKKKLSLWFTNEGRVFRLSVELHAWQAILHWLQPEANFLPFVSTLRKPKAGLKSFCSVKCHRNRWKRRIYIFCMSSKFLFEIWLLKDQKTKSTKFCTSWFLKKKCIDRIHFFFTFKWQSFEICKIHYRYLDTLRLPYSLRFAQNAKSTLGLFKVISLVI